MSKNVEPNENFIYFNSVPACIFVLRDDYTVIFWNDSIKEWSGIHLKKIIGKSIFFHFPQFNEPQYLSKIDEVFNNEQQIAIVLENNKSLIPSHDKKKKNIIQHVVAMSGESLDGKEKYAIITIRENLDSTIITTANDDVEYSNELQRLQKALDERSQLAALRTDIGIALAKGANIRVLLQYCTGAIIERSDAVLTRIWTYNLMENILELQASSGMYSHIDGFHSRIHMGSNKLSQIAQKRQSYLTNDVINDPLIDNHEWAEREDIIAFVGFPLVLEDELIGVVALFSRSPFSEITLKILASVADQIALGIKRKLAEEALRASEIRYRTLQANIPVGIYRTTPMGRIISVNPAMVNIFGCDSEEELISVSITQFYYDPKHRQELLKKLRRDGSVNNFEVLLKRKDGSIIWALISNRAILDEENNFLYLDGIVEDVTSRIKLEAERVQLRREISEKNKELDQIILVISHDLRTPFVNIQGFSNEIDQSLRELYSLLPMGIISTEIKEKISFIIGEDIPQSFNFIRKSSNKIDSLLKGLSRLSRLGRAASDIVELNMNEQLLEVIAAFEYRIIEQNVKIELEELPPCRGDSVQINQAFSNLFDNALKYMDPYKSGVIKFSGKEEDDKVIYCVEDNGIGIAKENLGKVFQIFQRINPNDTQGDGLGLIIVKKILDRHGGNISVESEFEKGSMFYVTLPRV